MGRTLIVGDVHGCRAELEALLDLTKFTTGDQMVLVGDLVARGPDSLGVLDVARREGALFVRGNHEEKLLVWHREELQRLRGGPDPRPLGRLHGDVARALRPIDWSMISNAPLWLDLAEHDVRVVHAGVAPGVPIEEQRKKTLLRVRAIGSDGEPISTRERGTPWGASYKGPPQIVFGHNAATSPQLHRWATGLDTGCVYGGRLTAVMLAEGQRIPVDHAARHKLLVSVPARRAYYYAPQYAGRRVA